MKTKIETPTTALEMPRAHTIKIIGVGGAGVSLSSTL